MSKGVRSKAKRFQKAHRGCGCWFCSPWTRALRIRALRDKQAGYEERVR